ncbi:ParB N-terminal domain-containing protein [Kibdelosporangium lantanae]
MQYSRVTNEDQHYVEELVPIDSLLPANSPRLAGESIEHAQVLAASAADLPPIVVQRGTMRVIDGMHRLRAARMRGQNEILVRFYDGDDDEAFIVAVRTNVTHGLPLSQADRTAAAARIIEMRPQWADRRIAAVTGLAATTVGAIRRRSTEASGRLNAGNRVGRDGKVRPIDNAEGRIRAGELIAQRPDAPIRVIAEAAGIAPATALDVRKRLRDGRHPVPDRQRGEPAKRRKRVRPAAVDPPPAAVEPAVDIESVLRELKKDPSLRFTDSGRALLRWLDAHTCGLDQWDELPKDNIPAHCVPAMVKLAQHNMEFWERLGKLLAEDADIDSA